MKARLPKAISGGTYLSLNKSTNFNSKDKVTMTLGELQKIISDMFDEKYDEVFESVRVDITSQMLAVMLYSKVVHDGYGKKRLLREIDNLKSTFKIMNEGVLGKTFSPLDIKEHFKDNYGIDTDEIIKGDY